MGRAAAARGTIDSLKTDEIPHLPYPSTRDLPLDIDLALSDSTTVTDFFYRDRLGAVRAGGSVRAFSRETIGLLISGLLSSFVYQMLRDSLQYLLEIRELAPGFIFAAGRFVDSTAVLAFFVGMLSDCVPICELRRKSYLLVGWAISCTVLFVMMVMTQSVKDYLSPYTFIVLAGCCSFGTMISYVASEIRLVELSQRESLRDRGFLVAVYTIFRISGQALGRVTSRLVLTATSWSSIRHGFVLLFLLSLVAPACVYKFLDEPQATRPRVPWRQGFAEFKLLIQQRVVRYIVAFVCVYTAFSNVRIADADAAVASWIGVGSPGAFTARVGRDFVAVITVCAWSGLLVNRTWSKVFALGPVFNSIPPALLNILVATKVYRASWFFFVVSSLSGVSDGIFRIAYLIPLVEICSVGSEGQTVGLALSFDKLLAIIIRTTSNELFKGVQWSLSELDVVKDLADARNRVAAITVAGNVLRLLALVALVFLPSQKLEAQRLRVFGNLSPAGASLVVAVFLLAFMGVLALDLSLYL